MKIKNINKKDNSFEYFIDLDLNSDLWKKSEANALKRIGKNIKVDGYRPGKVPNDVLKKVVSSRDIFAEAYSEVCKKLTKWLESQKSFLDNAKETIDAMYPPMLSIENDKQITDTISFKLTYGRYFKIDTKDYKNWKLNVKLEDVTDKDINEEIEKKLSESQMIVPKEGAVENGDIAVINFKGFIDDVAFPGGEATNYELKIGSKSFIDNFEDQLIGMKPGDTKDVHVTFPKEYHAPDLAGKKAKFEVKLNAVNQAELPKLTDEFVAEQKIENVKTIAEYKEFIKKQLVEAKQEKFKQESENEIIQNLQKNVDLDKIKKNIPNFVMETYINIRKMQVMRMFGITNVEQWKSSLKASGMDVEAFDKMQNEQFIKSFIINLITRQIAINEKLIPTDDEINKKIDDELKMSSKKEFDDDEKLLLSSVIWNEILSKNGYDFLINLYVNKKENK